MIFPSMMKFTLGNLVITPAALKAGAVDDFCRAIDRHVCGNWGEALEAVRLANESALLSGGRLLSVHRFRAGLELWVMTTPDRTLTTIFLTADYIPGGAA